MYYQAQVYLQKYNRGNSKYISRHKFSYRSTIEGTVNILLGTSLAIEVENLYLKINDGELKKIAVDTFQNYIENPFKHSIKT